MPVHSQPFPFRLSIEALAVSVHLGVTKAEQADPTTVTVWVDCHYPAQPDVIHSDGDYLCYDTLCRNILDKAAESPFALIETLCTTLYKHVRALVPQEVCLSVRVQKPLPPTLVGYTVKAASAVYSDLPEGIA